METKRFGFFVLFLAIIFWGFLTAAAQDKAPVLNTLLVETGGQQVWLRGEVGLPVAVLSLTDRECMLESALFDEENELAAVSSRVVAAGHGPGAATFALNVPSSKLWNAEAPTIYTLRLEILHEQNRIAGSQYEVGLREVALRENRLVLNHTPITLKGLHDSDGEFAQSQNRQFYLKRIKRLNANALVMPATALTDDFLALCDREGVYILPQLPNENWRRIVGAFHTHPSILLWMIDVKERDEPARWYHQIRGMDPSRPVLMASRAADARLQNWPLAGAIDPKPDNLAMLRETRFPTLLLSIPAGRLHSVNRWIERVYEQANLIGLVLDFQKDALPSSNSESFGAIKRLFSPIAILPKARAVEAGEQIVEVEVFNRYDFTNLRRLSGRWQLVEDRAHKKQGRITLNLFPKKHMTAAFPLTLPNSFERHEYFLNLQFYQDEDQPIYEHGVWLHANRWKEAQIERLNDLEFDQSWGVTGGLDRVQMNHQAAYFQIESASLAWFMRTNRHNYRLITGGPRFFIKTAEPQNDSMKVSERVFDNLLANHQSIHRVGKNVELTSHVFAPASPGHPPALTAQFDWLASPFGFIDIRYTLRLRDESAALLQAGLAFDLPPRLEQITYAGWGPHPAYRNLAELAFPGVFQFDLQQAGAAGPRRHVRIMAFTDSEGNGLGIMAFNQTIEWEKRPYTTSVRIHAFPPHHPKTHPQYLESHLPTSPEVAIFRLIPLQAENPPGWFQRLIRP